MAMQPRRYLVFCAHPDDCDLLFGGTAVKLAKAGHAVKFVSVCNGDCGHYAMTHEALARRRHGEAQASVRLAGIEEYQILGKIINGDNVGRANEDEFVITSSHGIAISDVAVGNMILQKAFLFKADTADKTETCLIIFIDFRIQLADRILFK